MHPSPVERQFGPPSEPIHVGEFAQDARAILAAEPPTSAPGTQSYREILDSLAPEAMAALEELCSVNDIRRALTETWNSPRVSVFLQKDQDDTLRALSPATGHAHKKSAQQGPFIKNDAPEIVHIKDKLSRSSLKCMKLQPGAELFARNSSFIDSNAFTSLKFTPDGASIASPETTSVITISFQSKMQSGHLAPTCQFAFISTQTLGDVFDALPCVSNELPSEIMDGWGQVTGYTTDQPQESSGCAVCIGGLAYGDGMSEKDYADKLVEHLEKVPKQGVRHTKAPTSLHDTPLDSLVLQVCEPYWMIHQGNCEHWLIVDEIRLLHPNDPTTGYPVGLWFPPILMDMCRACSKRIATRSVVGDARLKESPSLLCGVCWSAMGPPDDQGVVVVPLPKHEHGW